MRLLDDLRARVRQWAEEVSGGVADSGHSAVYLRQLKAWGYSVPAQLLAARWGRWSGDLVSLGKGELLTLADS